MAGSSNQFTYALGATLVIVATGLTQAVAVIPPANCNAVWLKWNAGGSLALVGNVGFTSAGFTAANGYLLGATEVFSTTGPAKFFLQATGATATAQVVWGFDAANAEVNF